jgi:hypothetical protein
VADTGRMSATLSDDGLIARALKFHPWDAMAPPALEALAKRGPFQFSAETGCGGSTILFSHLSQHHTAFAIEGTERTIYRPSSAS